MKPKFAPAVRLLSETIFLITFILVSIVVIRKIFNYSHFNALQITIISMAFFAATPILFAHKKPFFLLSIAILFSCFLGQQSVIGG